MTDDIEERAALARRGIMDHSDCEECTEDWTFLMRQGRREFPLGLRTVLACLAFAEREGAVPELPADPVCPTNFFTIPSSSGKMQLGIVPCSTAATITPTPAPLYRPTPKR